jgi:hypothetical protein
MTYRGDRAAARFTEAMRKLDKRPVLYDVGESREPTMPTMPTMRLFSQASSFRGTPVFQGSFRDAEGRAWDEFKVEYPGMPGCFCDACGWLPRGTAYWNIRVAKTEPHVEWARHVRCEHCVEIVEAVEPSGGDRS